MSMKMTLVGTIVVGLVLIGCGDDDEGADAGRDSGTRDAAMVGDAAMDAETEDAAMEDAATEDAETEDAAMDGAAMDGAAMDGAARDGGDAAAGAFSSTLALTPGQEVPPCAAAGAGAMGAGTVTINEANTMIQVMVTFSGLSAAPVAGHIHSGAPGVAGPVVLPFTDLTSPIMQTFTAANYPSPAPVGAPANFAAFIAAMRAGNTYVNLHTDDCASGEIRGQIE